MISFIRPAMLYSHSSTLAGSAGTPRLFSHIKNIFLPVDTNVRGSDMNQPTEMPRDAHRQA
jgi:hypothetical protein